MCKFGACRNWRSASYFAHCSIFSARSICFAKSSDRLNNWLINTKFYQNNLADFKAGKGMTVKTKVRILATVTLVMAIGLIAMLMKGIIVGSIILSVVWLGHIYYFGFKVKTREE